MITTLLIVRVTAPCTVKHADEIILMDEGGIKERGTHETLLALNGMYAALYKYQFRDS